MSPVNEVRVSKLPLAKSPNVTKGDRRLLPSAFKFLANAMQHTSRQISQVELFRYHKAPCPLPLISIVVCLYGEKPRIAQELHLTLIAVRHHIHLFSDCVLLDVDQKDETGWYQTSLYCGRT
jgi:hypothetical protein